MAFWFIYEEHAWFRFSDVFIKKLVNVWFFLIKKKADRSDNGLIKNFIAVYFVAVARNGSSLFLAGSTHTLIIQNVLLIPLVTWRVMWYVHTMSDWCFATYIDVQQGLCIAHILEWGLTKGVKCHAVCKQTIGDIKRWKTIRRFKMTNRRRTGIKMVGEATIERIGDW